MGARQAGTLAPIAAPLRPSLRGRRGLVAKLSRPMESVGLYPRCCAQDALTRFVKLSSVRPIVLRHSLKGVKNIWPNRMAGQKPTPIPRGSISHVEA